MSGKVFDVFIQMLIVISIIKFSIDTLPNLSTSTKEVLSIAEIVVVIVFTVEYLLRLWVSRPTWKYAFSFFGIIDLLAIAPFYLALAIDLRSLRAFRLFRLFRVLKLAKYSLAAQRFHRSLSIAKEEIILFLCLTMILLFLSAVGIYYFENAAQPELYSSIFHSLWWAVATLTTVGYGDVYPITVGGRIFTFFLLLIGLGIVSVPAGLVATALTRAREIENESSETCAKVSKDSPDLEN
ncbi:MAG: ion transporter [Planctomycetota bacterium]